MGESEFKKLIEDETAGRMCIGVDPAIARGFFVKVSPEKIKAETGEDIAFQKVVVLALMFLEYPLFFAASIFAVFAFHWWAALVIPISFVALFYYGATSSMGNRSAVFITALIICAVLASVFGALGGVATGAYVVFLLSSMWCSRVKYVFAVSRFRSFACRNVRCFNLVEPTLGIRRTTTTNV